VRRARGWWEWVQTKKKLSREGYKFFPEVNYILGAACFPFLNPNLTEHSFPYIKIMKVLKITPSFFLEFQMASPSY